MSWARLDDGFWRNEKIASCSDGALGLYVRAISYCADQQTEGKLSETALRMLKASGAKVKELVSAGLFELEASGYAIHDFLQYNPTNDEIAVKRAEQHDAKVRAGRAGGLARASRRLAEPKQRASSLLQAESKQIQAPSRPVPTRPDPVPREIPPNPPQAGGTRARRAQNGSGRKRDQDALAALPLEDQYLGKFKERVG